MHDRANFPQASSLHGFVYFFTDERHGLHVSIAVSRRRGTPAEPGPFPYTPGTELINKFERKLAYVRVLEISSGSTCNSKTPLSVCTQPAAARSPPIRPVSRFAACRAEFQRALQTATAHHR